MADTMLATNARKKKDTTATVLELVRTGSAAERTTESARSEARELIDLIARRKTQIGESFYDIGVALVRLKTREMLGALGRRSFAEMCKMDAGLSPATGTRLVNLVTSVTRDEALAMGATKAIALVQLAAASGGGETAATILSKDAVSLPNGRAIQPRRASAKEVSEAAALLRRARVDEVTCRKGGRSATRDDHDFAAALEKKLHDLGLDRARVRVLAMKRADGADLTIEHIPLAKIDKLRKALAAS